MSGMNAQEGVKKAVLRAQVTRADGTVVDLGVVAHTNPVLHLLAQLRLRFKKLVGII